MKIRDKIVAFLTLTIAGSVLLGVAVLQFQKEIKWFRTELDIKANGKHAIGTVVHVARYYSKFGKTTREYFQNTITYDGYEHKKHLRSPLVVGANISVLYLPNKPDKLIVGDQSDSSADLRGGKMALLLKLIFGLSVYIVIGGFGILIIFFIPVAVFFKKKTI